MVTKKKKSKKINNTKSSKKYLKSKSTSKNNYKIKKFEYDFGRIAFIFGILLSILVGIIIGMNPNTKMNMGIGIIFSIIFVMGLLVGILNITIKEVNEFLIASITFLVAAGINLYILQITLPVLWTIISEIYFTLGIFVAPAATVVAIKAMYELAKNK